MDGHQQVDARAGLPGEHHALGEQLGVDLLQRAAGAPGFVELGEFVLGLVGERAFAWGTTGGSALSLAHQISKIVPEASFEFLIASVEFRQRGPGCRERFGRVTVGQAQVQAEVGAPRLGRIEEAAGKLHDGATAEAGFHRDGGVFEAIQVRAAAQECGEFFVGRRKILGDDRAAIGQLGVFPLSFPVAPEIDAGTTSLVVVGIVPVVEERGVHGGEIQRANRVGHVFPQFVGVNPEEVGVCVGGLFAEYAGAVEDVAHDHVAVERVGADDLGVDGDRTQTGFFVTGADRVG